MTHICDINDKELSERKLLRGGKYNLKVCTKKWINLACTWQMGRWHWGLLGSKKEEQVRSVIEVGDEIANWHICGIVAKLLLMLNLIIENVSGITAASPMESPWLTVPMLCYRATALTNNYPSFLSLSIA